MIFRFCNVSSLAISLAVVALHSNYLYAQNPFATPASAYGTLSNITTTPRPGDGHSYLESMNETVNPANGALSIRIGVPVPHERGYNPPYYAFMYDSDQEITINMMEVRNSCTPGAASSVYSGQYGSAQCIFEVSQPKAWDTNYLNQINGANTTNTNTGPNTLVHTQRIFVTAVTNVVIPVCGVETGFIYEDVYGTKHNLGMTTIDSLSSQGTAPGAGPCGSFFGISNNPVGGDATYKAFTGAESPATTVNGNLTIRGETFITDPSGNTMDGLADGFSLIVDANGNSVRGTGRPGYYPGVGILDNTGTPSPTSNGTIMPGSSGIAMPVGTTSISFPGFSQPYVYTVANQSSAYGVGYTDITQLYAGVNENLCRVGAGSASSNKASAVLSGTPTGAYPKVTSIQLPNGQSYSLSYDPVYGLISKIVYPTGAWVEYTWSNNADSEMMGWQTQSGQNVDPIDGSTGEALTNGGTYLNSTFCYFHHDFPAISKRVVSYDGVNPSEQQDFTYSTVWNPQNLTLWQSKQTTVTTTDLIRDGHPNFKTVYTYTPATPLPVPFSHVQTSGFATRINNSILRLRREPAPYRVQDLGGPLRRSTSCCGMRSAAERIN